MLAIIDNVVTSIFFLGVVWLLTREFRRGYYIIKKKDPK